MIIHHQVLSVILGLLILLLDLFSAGCASPDKDDLATNLLLSPILVQDEVLYQDNFSDPDSGWRTGANGNLDTYYESGEYSLMFLKSGAMTYAIAPSDQFADFALEVEVRVLNYGINGSYGLIFRKQDNDNFYLFSVSDCEFRLLKNLNNEWQTIQDAEFSEYILDDPDTNKLKVVCQGSQIDLYANGQRLGSYTDSSIANGRIGLAVEDANTHIHFDNLKVYAVSGSNAVYASASPEPTTQDSLEAFSKSNDPLEPVIIQTKVLFEDDFSDPSSGWNTGSSEFGSWKYESGEYILEHQKAGTLFYIYAPQESLADFAFEVDVRTVDFGDTGITGVIFRGQKNNNYRFAIKDGAYCLVKYVNDEWQFIQKWQQSSYILASPAANKLRVACLGSQIDLYANGVCLGSYFDSSFASGGIGFAIEGINTYVHFDNLKVYAVSAPVPEPAQTCYDKAVQSQQSGDSAAAVHYYEEAIREYAMYSEAWNGKGEALSAQGQYAEALKSFQSAVQIDPQNIQAWLNEGKCLETLGDKSGAISCLNQILKLEPDNAEAKATKEKLVAGGIADNTSDPPVKQYASGLLLQVTGPALTISVNEGEAFTATLSVTNGQPDYSWFLKTDNGITSRINLSTNESGDTLTVSGIAALIDDDTTESRYAFIEVWAEDSSTLIRKGEGSFQVHVINTFKTPAPTPTALASITPSSSGINDSINTDKITFVKSNITAMYGNDYPELSIGKADGSWDYEGTVTIDFGGLVLPEDTVINLSLQKGPPFYMSGIGESSDILEASNFYVATPGEPIHEVNFSIYDSYLSSDVDVRPDPAYTQYGCIVISLQTITSREGNLITGFKDGPYPHKFPLKLNVTVPITIN